LRSTGPTSEHGKRRSRRNAIRHGLCAETVIEVVEDVDDYRGFEAAVIADYDAQTAVERELVLRLASLLWRLRRATAIETDLLRIQGEILNARQCHLGLNLDHPPERNENAPHLGSVLPLLKENSTDATPATDNANDTRRLTNAFQRLVNLDNAVFKRLARYESALWRQTLQTVFALRTARRP
jgi:hypothetical protein